MVKPMIQTKPPDGKPSVIDDNILLNRKTIIYEAKLNKSGKSYYIYIPRRYNNLLRKVHEERQGVRVIVIP